MPPAHRPGPGARDEKSVTGTPAEGSAPEGTEIVSPDGIWRWDGGAWRAAPREPGREAVREAPAPRSAPRQRVPAAGDAPRLSSSQAPAGERRLPVTAAGTGSGGGRDPGPPPGPTSSTPPAPPFSPRLRATAADLRSEEMLRPSPVPPAGGWRRLAFGLSGGRLNPGPGARELRRRELWARVRAPVAGCRRIAVVSRKGGIGKTTTALMLGHQLALIRGDRVVALDANPDAGSLADRIVRQTPGTVSDLIGEADALLRYSDVRRHTSQAPSRLEVVASNNDPRITEALGEAEYTRVLNVLARHYSLVVSDTGTGVLDSATRGILNLADQLVLCAAPSLDASRVSALTLDWLEEHGYRDLAREAVVVINAVRPRALVELDLLQRYFEHRCRAVVRLPWDPRLAAGAETAFEELAPATRAAYLELAAVVADGFALPGRNQAPTLGQPGH